MKKIIIVALLIIFVFLIGCVPTNSVITCDLQTLDKCTEGITQKKDSTLILENGKIEWDFDLNGNVEQRNEIVVYKNKEGVLSCKDGTIVTVDTECIEPHILKLMGIPAAKSTTSPAKVIIEAAMENTDSEIEENLELDEQEVVEVVEDTIEPIISIDVEPEEESFIETIMPKSLVDECTDVCVENSGSSHPAYRASCRDACATVEALGGEADVKDIIEMYESSIQFKNDLENGIYNEDISQCAEWKMALIETQNEFWHFIGNFDEAHQKEVDLEKERENCKEEAENWVLKENKANPLGIEYKEEADSIEAKEEKVMNECYPTVFEYKTLVYTSRNELDQHDIEEETISECLSKVEQPEFEDYIQVLITDMPNWK